MTCLLGLVPAVAEAHAKLTRAAPVAGSTVTQSPERIVLEFSESVEAEFSRVSVVDADGREMTKGKLELVPGRKDAMAVALLPLLPGPYKVMWRMVSTDTHVTKGSYTFNVVAAPSGQGR